MRGADFRWLVAGLSIVTAVVVAGCNGPQSSTSIPFVGQNAAYLPRPESTQGPGNIYWDKYAVHLSYPPKYHGKATLYYWAPDGYYLEPLYCKQKGRISATTHRHGSAPSGYKWVVFWFVAQSPGPNHCVLTAVLGKTGSPPLAGINIDINGK